MFVHVYKIKSKTLLMLSPNKTLQEHLFIVCELLRANLYEFQKFNQESGGEAYFTLRRLQVCLVTLITCNLFPVWYYTFASLLLRHV